MMTSGKHDELINSLLWFLSKCYTVERVQDYWGDTRWDCLNYLVGYDKETELTFKESVEIVSRACELFMKGDHTND